MTSATKSMKDLEAERANKPKSEPAPALPKKKEIEPKNVQINAEGYAWREILVRLPENITADDLRDPKIWRHVQVSRQHALTKFDHLFILTFDEGQLIRAVVTHAGPAEAHLAIEKVGTFREQGASFYSDGTLEVFWSGSGFGIRRVADKVATINMTFTTEASAINALHASYPKRVG